MSRILDSLFGDSRSPFPRSLPSLLSVTRFTPRRLWCRLQKSTIPLKTPKPDLCLIPSSTSAISVLSTKWSVGNFATLGLEQLRSPNFAVSPDDPAQFRLSLYPRGDNATSEYVSLFVEMLPNERVDQVSAFLKLLIEDGNGGKYIGCNSKMHTFTRGGTPWGYHQFMKRKELLNPLKLWLPNDTLEITCEILLIPPCSAMTKQNADLLDDLCVSPKPESIETYEEWLNDESLVNVTFLLGETVIPANKYILAKRSSVLKEILEENEGNGQIEIPDTEGEVFRELINYLYTGKIPQLKVFAEKLLLLTTKYQISDLKSQCEAHLCSVLSPEIALDYYQLAEATKANKLRSKVIDYMRRAIIQSLQGKPSLLGFVFESQILAPYLQSNWLQKELLNRRSRRQASTLSFSHLWRITNFNQLLDPLTKKRFPVMYSSNFGPSSTADSSVQFHLELHTRGVHYLSRNYLSLFLNMATSKNSKEKVQFTFSIIDSQGRKVRTKGNGLSFRSKVVRRGHPGLGCNYFVKRSTLLGDCARYLPKNTLSILVEIKILSEKTSTDASHCSKKLELAKKMDDPSYEPSSWLANEKLSDVLLLLSGEEEAPIWAHKIVLARGSPVFATMFKVPMRESAEGRVTITEEDGDAFKRLLFYLYTGKVGQLKGNMASRLLVMADKYQVDSLKDLCQEHLSSTVCLENALELLEFAKLNNVQKLKSDVIGFIQKPTLEAIQSLSDSQLLLQLFTKLVLTSNQTNED